VPVPSTATLGPFSGQPSMDQPSSLARAGVENVRPPSVEVATAMSLKLPGYTCRHAATIRPPGPAAIAVLQQ